jgi:hypothetical protein
MQRRSEASTSRPDYRREVLRGRRRLIIHADFRNTDVTLTISNCDAFPYRTLLHTTAACLNLFGRFVDCWWHFGGNFVATIPCYCGGSATVTAQDVYGNSASGTAPLPC